MIAFSSAYFFAYLATSCSRFSSRCLIESLAMVASVLEREFEGDQQRLALVVGLRRGGDADVQATQRIHLVVLDFRDDALFLDADVVVTAAVARAARASAKLAHRRQRGRPQP